MNNDKKLPFIAPVVETLTAQETERVSGEVDRRNRMQQERAPATEVGSTSAARADPAATGSTRRTFLGRTVKRAVWVAPVVSVLTSQQAQASPACGSFGDFCGQNSDCCSDSCAIGPMSCSCKPTGESCETDEKCCSLSCNVGTMTCDA